MFISTHQTIKGPLPKTAYNKETVDASLRGLSYIEQLHHFKKFKKILQELDIPRNGIIEDLAERYNIVTRHIIYYIMHVDKELSNGRIFREDLYRKYNEEEYLTKKYLGNFFMELQAIESSTRRTGEIKPCFENSPTSRFNDGIKNYHKKMSISISQGLPLWMNLLKK